MKCPEAVFLHEHLVNPRADKTYTSLQSREVIPTNNMTSPIYYRFVSIPSNRGSHSDRWFRGLSVRTAHLNLFKTGKSFGLTTVLRTHVENNESQSLQTREIIPTREMNVVQGQYLSQSLQNREIIPTEDFVGVEILHQSSQSLQKRKSFLLQQGR